MIIYYGYQCLCDLFILFYFAGKAAADETKLGLLKLKPNTKIMMMGSREESLVPFQILYDFCLFMCKKKQAVKPNPYTLHDHAKHLNRSVAGSVQTLFSLKV